MAADFLFARSSSMCTGGRRGRALLRQACQGANPTRPSFHQFDYTVFKMVGGDVAGAGFLQLLDFFRQRLDQLFQALRRGGLGLSALRQRAGERFDAACEIIEFGLGTRRDGE